MTNNPKILLRNILKFKDLDQDGRLDMLISTKRTPYVNELLKTLFNNPEQIPDYIIKCERQIEIREDQLRQDKARRSREYAKKNKSLPSLKPYRAKFSAILAKLDRGNPDHIKLLAKALKDLDKNIEKIL